MPISGVSRSCVVAALSGALAAVLLTGCPSGGGGDGGSGIGSAHGQPSTPAGAQQSTNWSGYLITGSAGSFNRATANWIVPTVQCTGGTTTASSTWAGVGGGTSSDPTLIQAGTEEDCSNGPTYYAWWEALPAPSNMVIGLPLSTQNYTVKPGDLITVTVDGSNLIVWTITIQNFTGGWIFTTTVPYLAAGASVEWIQEAPQTAGTGGAGQATLSNYGRVSFTGITANGANPHLSTSEGVSMVDSSSNVISTPSAPGLAGDSFSVCYGAGTCL